MPLIDPFNREISYMRVSVTDRCNLRCDYCMPENGIHQLPNSEILSFEEIYETVKQAIELGINKVRITGGEPLVRKDIVDLLRMIRSIPGIDDLGMTTNAQLLEDYSEDLAAVGLDRVNISLDTLNPEKFRLITRGGDLSKTLRGIFAANKAMLLPIKINCVIKSSDDLNDAAEIEKFANRYGFKVRKIHLMSLKNGTFSQVEGGEGGNCTRCNRIRLTASGDVMPCLFNDAKFNIRKMGIKEAIMNAVNHKPESGIANNSGEFFNIGG